ncbi:MAG: nucleotidyl transferase AbiEii/AbiGii toxin family protein [Candidatus Cloacimonetes bacterium]|nr:nucleotidyl transferase AbiEii/AbiGii toxin family protein [Candidatus Cloacimonadota bacterium]
MEPLKIHRQALSGPLWDLLASLMQEPLLASFVLVGGTALALHLGHRQSEDIDMFSQSDFNATLLAEKLSTKYPVDRIYHEEGTVSGFINHIKTDLLLHPYPIIEDMKVAEGIRLASLKDIAAMKLNAISGRGMKKDFWDIAILLDFFSLSEMIGFFQNKYNTADSWHLLKALSYLQEADKDLTPINSFTDVSWDKVKQRISFAVNKML